jgi:hypothetical protein
MSRGGHERLFCACEHERKKCAKEQKKSVKKVEALSAKEKKR